jgi:hypothetical protein
MASSLEFTFSRAKPATSSLDSVNGPSVTLSFPLDERNARAQLAGQAAFRCEQPAGPEAFLDQFAHRRHFLLGRGNASLGRLIDTQESCHFSSYL